MAAPPVPSPAELQALIEQLLATRARVLQHRPLRTVLPSLAATAAVFLDPTSQARREAEAILPAETGLSPQMIRHVLPLLFQEYRAERLTALVQEELGTLDALDTFGPALGSRRKAYGPALITHVLAGNLPGVGLDSVLFALLVKSAALVKVPSAAPSLPLIVARTLAGIDPDLGGCVAVVSWPGGHAALEEIAFARADIVVASGTDESIAAIQRQVRGRFVGYGHKVSFSVITKERLEEAALLARHAAYDVVLFDQRGCLSPQLMYVEAGGSVSPWEFAALLAQALQYWQTVLPRGSIPPEASVAIRRLRDEAEWQALAGQEVVLYASAPGTEWTVMYEADRRFVPSPLYRTVRVKPFSTLAELAEALSPWRAHLEAAGIAADPDRLPELADLLGQAGVSRIAQLGTLQTPPLSWRHGGRPRLADFVRWVTLEEASLLPVQQDKE
ncbi:MAG: hypothetical protein NZ578_11925 [Candidatus Binatia bacterium]|nr:hypothetical protein [Candidatus Binatia bacterium]